MMRGYGVESNDNIFSHFVIRISISHDFHAQICFHLYFITLSKLLLAIRRLFDHKPDKLLPRTLYRIRVTANVILKV